MKKFINTITAKIFRKKNPTLYKVWYHFINTDILLTGVFTSASLATLDADRGIEILKVAKVDQRRGV